MKDIIFGGTYLSSFGTLTSVTDLFKAAEPRGDNQVIPYSDGRRDVTRYFDQKIFTLGLSIEEESIQELEAAIDNLKAVCGARSQQLFQAVMEDRSIRQGYAKVRGNLNPNRISPTAARLALDFVFLDPFLRSNTLTTVTQTINSSPFTYTLTNPGTAEERKSVIRFTGPLAYPQLTNLANNVWVGYNAVLTAGHYVDIDCGAWTAVDDASANVIGNILHSGDSAFMALLAGANPMSVTDGTHTTGTVRVTFYPPYF